MAIYLPSAALYSCESTEAYAQIALASTESRARVFENRGALIIVTGADGKVLLSILGVSKWYFDANATLDGSYSIQWNYRSSTTSYNSSVDDVVGLTPMLSYLRVTPVSAFDEVVRNVGQATRAFVVFDVTSQYNVVAVDKPTQPWPAEYWDGTQAFDSETLPETLPYLEVSVGDMDSDASLKLTRTELLETDGTVTLADPYIDIFFPNVIHDHSNVRAEMEALLASIPNTGPTMEALLAAEAESAEAAAAAAAAAAEADEDGS